MSQKRGFITAGTWCADHNKVVETWPDQDMIARILHETHEGGGSACNFAVDIRRLDNAMPVETIGIAGDDADGRMLVETADRHGVGRDQLQLRADLRTSYADAYAIHATGRRTHLYYTGASDVLDPDAFDFSRTLMRILHLGMPGVHAAMDRPFGGEPNGWVHVLKAARRRGLQTNMELVSIDADRLRALVEPCLAHLDYLVVNDHEIGAVAGRRTSTDGIVDLEAVRAAGADILARSPVRMVTVHFPAGAFHLARNGAVTFAPPVAVPADAIEGSNGAGDAFAAGLLYATHEGWPAEQALRLAHCAAAASLLDIGTTSGVMSVADCLALGERWGWREDV